MLCEMCKKNKATVLLSTIKDGKKVELHLCKSCANDAEKLYLNNLSFQNFFNSLLGMVSDQASNVQKENKFEVQCPMCNMAYSEFKKNGKFGCAQCYVTFGKNLNNLLKRIHGTDIHTGKIPKRTAGNLIRIKKINSLKNSLQEAIQKEEYEIAAKLRDETREIEREEKDEK